MEPVYVCGHRNPDTDSICSSIVLAELLKQKNQPAIACKAGPLNKETAFVLDFFGVKEPADLRDARNTLAEIALDPPVSLHPDMSMRKALEILRQNEKQTLAVTENGKVIGMLSLQDISKTALYDTALSIELLSQTPISSMASVLNGEILFEAGQRHLNGKVSIVVESENGTGKYEVSDRIVITGNDPEAQKALIDKGAGLLILVWTDTVDPDVVELARKKNCSILLSGHGAMNTSRYLYLAAPISLVMKTKVVFLSEADWIEEAGRKMAKTRFRSYPVISRKGKLIGYADRYHLLNARNKTVYMVDHNSFFQGVNGLEKAEIAGVIDHHRISDFSTIRPVSFRNEQLGCTCSILYKMAKEQNLKIEPKIAGLMLAAVLSDTLHFQSVTCTDFDREAAEELKELAKLPISIDELARRMLAAGSSLDEMSEEEILSFDQKEFNIEGFSFLISQVMLSSREAIKDRMIKIREELERKAEQTQSNCVLCLSLPEENGSFFYWSGDQEKRIREAFGQEQGLFHPDILSRKNQIVPMIAAVFSS